MIRASELKLRDIIQGVSFSLNTVKVYYNNEVIYNDYDSEIQIEPGVYGELFTPSIAIQERHPELLDKIIFGLRAEIVSFHHSIVWFEGEE